MKLHEMKQKRATIAGQMRKLHDENSEKRWDEALTKQWGDMNQELRDLDAAIAREEQLLSLDTDDLNSDPERRSLIDTDTSVTEARQIKVIDTMLRGGFSALDTEQRQLFKEMRAQTVGTGSEGESPGVSQPRPTEVVGRDVPSESVAAVARRRYRCRAVGVLARHGTERADDQGNQTEHDGAGSEPRPFGCDGRRIGVIPR